MMPGLQSRKASRWLAGVAVAAAATLLLSGTVTADPYGRWGTAYNAPNASYRHVPPGQFRHGHGVAVVRMGDDLNFRPFRVTIRQEDLVVWENTSHMDHTVTAVPWLAARRRDVNVPVQALPFGSGRLRPGEQYSHRFVIPGVYRYVCLLHEGQGMIGEIEVLPRGPHFR
jgi:plastocyanin